MMKPSGATRAINPSFLTSVMTAIFSMMTTKSTGKTLTLPPSTPKIWCKQCHARLEINDPGCKRDDCKIAEVDQFRRDLSNGLYVPISMGKKSREKRKTTKADVVILDQGTPPPREEEIISSFRYSSTTIDYSDLNNYFNKGPEFDPTACF